MVGDEGGDAARATAYYGHSLSADVVGEWARRFYATANTVRVTSARALSEFIRRHAREAGEQPVGLHEGRVPVLLLTAQAAHDTLLLRYLAHRFVNIGADGGVVGGNGGARLALAHCHVLGPLSGASAGALIAQALGVTELPALAIWRDGVARPPEVHRLGGGGGARSAPEADADAAAKGLPGEVAQRVRVVRLLERRGRPRLPKLRASNVQRLCTHPARHAPPPIVSNCYSWLIIAIIHDITIICYCNSFGRTAQARAAPLVAPYPDPHLQPTPPNPFFEVFRPARSPAPGTRYSEQFGNVHNFRANKKE
ncbi:hypothetical protein T492DRAFT_88259 [Pavlovales sp. CCMP2436]|nr:hypothetical protein T492DRAFT_88259 [Pavlovales sp. CCMP2436]